MCGSGATQGRRRPPRRRARRRPARCRTILTSRHDQEYAPPGPHSLAADAAMAMQAPDNLADAPEAPAAPSRYQPQTAPAAPPAPPIADPDDGPAIAAADETKADMRAAPAPDNHPPASGREAVLAAFNRPRQPQPAAPQPTPPLPRPPERQAGRQAEEIDIGEVDWVLIAFRIGNIPWPRVLGAEPGDSNCRAPAAVSNATDLHDARGRRRRSRRGRRSAVLPMSSVRLRRAHDRL